MKGCGAAGARFVPLAVPGGIGHIGAMRLLFFNSQFPQPSQTFVVDQIRHATRLGLDVTVYAKRYSPQLAAAHAPDLGCPVLHDRPRDAATLRRIAAGLARSPGLLRRYAAGRGALGLHASDLACAAQMRHAPDVIVANFGQNGVVAARIKQAFFPGARLAVIFHGWDVSAYVAANGWEAYRRAAPAIDVAIAVNRPWAERLAANTPLRDVIVHHLGVDLAKVRPLPPAARDGAGFRIVFVGRMGEKKAIIFSTHILEEVDAVCSRAIIIDRGQIVANGTPAQLRQKSDVAGAVLVRVKGTSASELKDRLAQLPGSRKVLVVSEGPGATAVRVYPKGGPANGELARGIAELAAAQRWNLEELHTEEGRLDEVFRTITLPETVAVKEEARP